MSQSIFDPLPAACGQGWAADSRLFTAECGASMSTICGDASTEHANGEVIPAMLDPSTSCGLWYGALMTSLRNSIIQGGTLSMAPGIAGMDAAVEAYCTTNPGVQACACAAFPELAKDFCTKGPFACTIDGVCAASQFAQILPNPPGGFEVISFGKCNPYPCWFEPCTTADDSQMLRTSALALASCSTDLCIQQSSANTISLGPTMTPLPAGSFQVGGMVQSCQTGASQPPLLATAPVNIAFAANATMQLGTLLANNGDQSTSWSVTSTPPWLVTAPGSGLLGGNATQNWLYLFDSETVISQASETPISGTVEVVYSVGSLSATLSVPVSVAALPPTQQTVQIVETLRPQDIATLVLLSVLILAAVVVFQMVRK